MGKLISIDKETGGSETSIDSGSHYPYGTSITLNDDMVDEFGVGNLKVGDEVTVTGVAIVTSKSEHSNESEGSSSESKSVSFQLTEAIIDKKALKQDHAAQLYKD